jgi:soluble lytic murein transglycosylase-like protein
MKNLVDENKYDSYFKIYGTQYGVEPLLLKAQVKQESMFNTFAVSKCGAKGLAQFMPKTWIQYAGNKEAFNPQYNVEAQAHYMRDLLKHYKNDIDKALAAYNWGQGNVDKLKSFVLSYLPEETHHYVININQYYLEFKAKGAL